MSKTSISEDGIDMMNLLDAAEWLEENGIPFEDLESLDEIRLRIKREIKLKENQNNQQTKYYDLQEHEVGFVEYSLPYFLMILCYLVFF